MSIACLRRLGHSAGWLCVALLAGALGASSAAAQSPGRPEQSDSPPARDPDRQPAPRDPMRLGLGPHGPGMPAPMPRPWSRATEGAGDIDAQMRMLDRILEMPLLKRHIELIQENARLKAQLEIQEHLRHRGEEREGLGEREHAEHRERADRERQEARERAEHARAEHARAEHARAEHAEREHAEQRERMEQQHRWQAENEMLRAQVRELEARLHQLQADIGAKLGNDRRGGGARRQEARRDEARRDEARRDEASRDEAQAEARRERDQDDDNDEDDKEDDEEDEDDRD